MKARLLEKMQSYIAETCVGASALRNQGGSGLVSEARKYFKTLDLAAIPTEETHFRAWLDTKTSALRNKFPQGARSFGTARKALNLFLRSAAYNFVLNRAYRLDRTLPLLEVPLDSYAALHLAVHDPSLPRKWARLKWVTKTNHGKYQLAALALAKRWKVHRVDLDVFFYREDKDAA